MTAQITGVPEQVRPALDFVDGPQLASPEVSSSQTFIVGEQIMTADERKATVTIPTYNQLRSQELGSEIGAIVGLNDEADIAFSGAIRAFEAMSRIHSPARKALEPLTKAIEQKMVKLDELQVRETVGKKTVEDCDADRQSYEQEQRDTRGEQGRAQVRRDEQLAKIRQRSDSARGRYATLSVEDQSDVSTQNMIIKQKQRRLEELEVLIHETKLKRTGAVEQLHVIKREIEILLGEISGLVEDCEPYRKQLEKTAAYFASVAIRPEIRAESSNKEQD